MMEFLNEPGISLPVLSWLNEPGFFLLIDDIAVAYSDMVTLLCSDGKIGYSGKRPTRADILLEVRINIYDRTTFQCPCC